MFWVVAAAAFFVGIHVFISGTRLRDSIVERTGERGFQGLFSLLSVVGIVWLAMAYSRASYVALWAPLPGSGLLALVLVLAAFLLVVTGFTTPSPTAVGGEALLDRGDPATGILRVTRHPFLWGVALWAFAHLLTNGDAASLVLFGSLLVLALIGPFSIDAKRARKLGVRWRPFADRTSSVPFAAILTGRNTFVPAEIGWWRIGLAVAIYLIFLVAHGPLFGVPPFPA